MYNTKQKEAIIEYLKSNSHHHITVKQLMLWLEQKNISVGKTTIYRHLESLVKLGAIRQDNLKGEDGICYQYIGDTSSCNTHQHLKCKKCGKLIHVDCKVCNDMEIHLLKEHDFKIDYSDTVLYGVCGNCLKCENLVKNRKRKIG